MFTRPVYLFLNLMLLLMKTSVVMSAQVGDSVNFNFTGTYLMTTLCTMNNDSLLNISFGNVGISKVNGINYAQNIPYLVDCKGATDNSPVRLMVEGAAVAFDSSALVTSADGLGISIQANGQPMGINKVLKTTLGALQSLKLTAVPVKDPNKELTEHPFTAAATLMAEYE